jgi:hypothetical protein
VAGGFDGWAASDNSTRLDAAYVRRVGSIVRFLHPAGLVKQCKEVSTCRTSYLVRGHADRGIGSICMLINGRS